MEAIYKCLLILALAAYFGQDHVRALGVQDFRDLDMFPVNTYGNRIIFYLDSDCDIAACQNSCTMLNFGIGKCSNTPSSNCHCPAQTELKSKMVQFNDASIVALLGTNYTRIYQFANDWTIYPPLRCDYPGAFPDNCERSCRQLDSLNRGICLKFTERPSVCACKLSYRRPAVATVPVDPVKEMLITAPFPALTRKQRVAVQNSSVYLSTNLCRKKDCENVCSKFNLANGNCGDYFNSPACECDTGMNETRVVSDLRIRSYAGGIYTLNGWHLFEYDPEMECTDASCAVVCQVWGFDGSGVACFAGAGITNSCGCMEYKSTVPSEEELAEARKSSTATRQLNSASAHATIAFLLSFCFWSLP